MTKAIVLMYHNIAIPPEGVTLPNLYVAPSIFRFHMWYLKAAGFRVVPLGDILSFISGDISTERLVALTFDDGYQDFYNNAYPVLTMYGYPSTVFLIHDFVGKRNLWGSKDLHICKRLLGWDEILEMKDNGVVFGSHTKTHPFLSKLSQEKMEDEICGSKVALEERLNLPVDFFCYPYGNYDERAMAVVRKAGYRCATTAKGGLVNRNDNPFKIGRASITYVNDSFLNMFKLH